MKKTTSTAAAIYVLAAGILWGMMGLYVRRLNAAGLFAIEVVQLRVTLGMALVGGYLLLFQRDRFRIRWRDLWCFFGTGICSLLLFTLCYFTGMTKTSLSVIAVLLYTAPFFVTVLSVFLFREKLNAPKVAALAVTFLGCFLVAGIGSDTAVSLEGFLLGIGSGFFYALYSIFGRYAIRRGYDSWTITFYTFAFASLGCAFLTDWPSIGTAFGADSGLWIWVILLGLLTAFLPYVFYTRGLQGLESSRASLIASVEPVVATLMGTFVFHEAISAGQIAGVFLVLIGIAVPAFWKKP